MIQKIILAPFNFIFKIISFVLSNFWYGFLVLCYLVYYVVSSFFRTITFPIRYILKKKKNSEKNLLKQEKHRKEKLSKLQKIQERQKAKERKYLEEQERIAAKKREKEADSIVFTKRKRKKIGEIINDFIMSVISIPKKIKEKNDEAKRKQLERKNFSRQV